MKDELEKYYDRINLEAPNTVASYSVFFIKSKVLCTEILDVGATWL